MSEQLNTYTPKGVALVSTWRCPGGCEHCNIDFASMTEWPEMPAGEAVRVMAEARALGINSVQLCGGEPLLRPDFVLEIAAAGARMGTTFHRPPTTGFSGAAPLELEALLRKLRDTGWRSGFRLSVDWFHRRVPLEAQAGFIEVYSRVFPLKSLAIGCCDADRGRSAERLGALAELLAARGLGPAAVGEKRLETAAGAISLGFWSPTRPTWTRLDDSMFEFKSVSFQKVSDREFARATPIQPFGCLGPKGVGYLWVEPDGAVRACCGNANCFIDRLIIGNAYREPLAEMVDRARRDPLIAALAEGGPVALAGRLPEAIRREIAETQFTHRCELCHRLLCKEGVG